MPWMLRHASKLSVPGSSKARSRDEARAEVGPLDEKISGSPYRKRSGLFRGGLISFSLETCRSAFSLPLTEAWGHLLGIWLTLKVSWKGNGSGFLCQYDRALP